MRRSTDLSGVVEGSPVIIVIGACSNHNCDRRTDLKILGQESHGRLKMTTDNFNSSISPRSRGSEICFQKIEEETYLVWKGILNFLRFLEHHT